MLLLRDGRSISCTIIPPFRRCLFSHDIYCFNLIHEPPADVDVTCEGCDISLIS